MSIRLRGLIAAAAFAACVPHGSSAQLDHVPYALKFNSGQDIQPIFEGWSRNADGSFTMHFGYLNRNYVEELSVTIGPDNNLQPGRPDRGQPTYFYTRQNHRVFSVPVPKDWGKKELVWTVTAHGKTNKAIAWLQAEWEIDPVVGGRRPTGEAAKNQPPTIAVDAVQPITLPGTATLSANVTDDGLPPQGRGAARGKPAVGQETPPILQPGPGNAQSPVNLPQLRTNPRGQRVTETPPSGLSVTYIVWRGPGGIAAEPRFALVKDGKATTIVTFTKPGDYVLRARAWDGALATEQDVKVVVTDR